jgi:hypothetical protein
VAPKKKSIQSNKAFYSDSSSDEQDDRVIESGVVELDDDHDLLLKGCVPLLQSRNSGVNYYQMWDASCVLK